ncbi:EAL domain-containing protein [Vibrio sp. SCSIO 43136]|uniref:putative bifunctional diguanylate cyclase/phosphodiesterase n=1 Tax=Vibrio sp. SCSIO 43136 TaxID=2819101 RepID=UPI002075F715|nr:EAL domain-containing protein [Vibrio sp. SCSIO 43136]USD68182.1 EAL domain-containing protein [Vibrio sp. SCSIO 43136]
MTDPLQNTTSNKTVHQSKVESTRLLYANTVSGLAISFIASTALVFGFDGQGDEGKVIWWALMMVLLLVRSIDAFRYHRSSLDEQFVNIDSNRVRFCVGVAVTAVMWSGYAVTFYPFTSVIELTSTIVLMSAMAGGAANILSGSKRTAMFYSAVLIIPLSLVLMFSQAEYYVTLGVLGVLFAVVMIMSSAKSATFTEQAISLRFENTELLEKMEQRVEERTEKIYRLSSIDPMTNFLNRKAFFSTVATKIAAHSNEKFVLFFIDLDGFKQVNDSLGHEVGDIVIRETSHRISELCPDPNNKCRWGGDEFLIIKKISDGYDPNDFATQVIEQVSRPHIAKNFRASVGATIGIALYPEHGDDLDTLIQSADMAMYQQKRMRKGLPRIFDQSLRNQVVREHRLSELLVQAIEQDDLRMVYQPIVKATTREVVSLEALIRWNVNGEEISATELIDIAEQYGLISKIGLWVVERACSQGKDFITRDPKLTISINVSVSQLLDRQFVDNIKCVLERVNFPANALNIEITESVFAHDKQAFLRAISALQKLDIRISIDDFGTGYSSLSSMLDIGVDIVKIDKSFIHNMDERGVSIIDAVVQMASSLNFLVVAEGVETKEQADQLSAIGISYLQGDYFTKPIEASNVKHFLRQNQQAQA